MPRSSRHKSSKHSSKDARDYSDSEESSLRERKGKEESSYRSLKEPNSLEKQRKVDMKDSKDLYTSGNVEYMEDSRSLKRRKDKLDDVVNGRWNGGEDDRGEPSKKLKASIEKDKRKSEIIVEEVKKSGSGKGEGKHRESNSRKDGREVVVEKEKEKKYREGKSERLPESDEQRPSKTITEKTDLSAQGQLQTIETEKHVERRSRRKRDGSGDRDKYYNDTGDTNRHLSSKDDIAKDGIQKEEKPRDEKYREKHHKDDRDIRHRSDKECDERYSRDHTIIRPTDKVSKDDKNTADVKQKKSKPLDSDGYEQDYNNDREHAFDPPRERVRDRDGYCDHDSEREREKEHARGDRDKGRDRDRSRRRSGRDHERDLDQDRDWDREKEQNWDLDRDRDHNHDRYHDSDDRDRDVDERNVRHKEGRGRKRSPDYRDDLNDTKYRTVRANYTGTSFKSLSSSKVEADADRGKSQSRQVHGDVRKKASPTSNLHGGTDEFRRVLEQKPKSTASREMTGFAGASDRGSMYRSSDKSTKMDDGQFGELSLEKPSSSRASPMRLKERSPSSTSLERRYLNRSGSRRSPASEDRRPRDLYPEKSLGDESSQRDVTFYNKATQSSSSLIPPPSVFRNGVSSPSMGSLEEDNRLNINSRYKRAGDPNMGRGQGNTWRGPPNWSSSPIPNGFIPFQHGPTHGGYQAMMPQFPSPLFGLRPPMEMNHSGIPYHLPEAERYSNHMRPFGWPNMVDGSGPSPMHGWDGNNSVYRDESHMYPVSEWEQNRHLMNGRLWESGADMWKRQNTDANTDLESVGQRETYPEASIDDMMGAQTGKSENSNLAKSVEEKSRTASPARETSKSLPQTPAEKTSDPANESGDNYFAYLSMLDISEELAGPELHSQYMILLEKDQHATPDEETAVLVNLRGGREATLKSSISLKRSSLAPVPDDSLYKRAIALYKKQRVEISGLATLNDEENLPASKLEAEEEVNEHGSVPNLEAKEELESAPKLEAKEELDPSSTLETHHLSLNTCPKSEVMVQDLGRRPEEDLEAVDGKMIAIEQVIPEDAAAGKNQLPSPYNTSNVYNEKAVDEGDVSSPKVVLSDEPLVLESNESELLLSGIHYSPESTH